MSSRPPKQLPWSLALGAAGFSAIAPLSASALTIGLATPFSNTATVSDTCTAGSATTLCSDPLTSAPLPLTVASPTLTQFDPSQGVLTGTTLVLESTRTQTLQGGLTGSTAGAKTSGSGRSDGNLSAPGVNQGFAQIANKITATVPTGQTSVSFGPTSDAGTATNASLLVPGVDLNTYVGGGTVIANLTAPNFFRAFSDWTSPVSTKGSSTAKYTLAWDGKLTAQYDYLLHASPSFNKLSGLAVLTLDFGTVYLDDIVSPLTFQIFNLAGERVGLDLDSITANPGNSSKLTTNLSAPFQDLSAGMGSTSYSAFFDTSDLGVFGASYQLLLSDQDTGASASRFNNLTLTLNLQGTVVSRPPAGTEIPELDAASGTGAVSLLVGALALVGENRRKRKKT